MNSPLAVINRHPLALLRTRCATDLQSEPETADLPRAALPLHHARVRLRQHGDEHVQEDDCSENHVEDVHELHDEAVATDQLVAFVEVVVEVEVRHADEEVEGEEE